MVQLMFDMPKLHNFRVTIMLFLNNAACTNLLSHIVFKIVSYDYVNSFLDQQNAEVPLLKKWVLMLGFESIYKVWPLLKWIQMCARVWK